MPVSKVHPELLRASLTDVSVAAGVQTNRSALSGRALKQRSVANESHLIRFILLLNIFRNAFVGVRGRESPLLFYNLVLMKS